ncbi:MAG TPA: glutathione S-transferase [Candidatus Binataceae bacterium]|nr:glutathione S-transferase [Candidatus Binataceae bacterium]
MSELKLVGGLGSPYSRKMRAVMRYRRIPFQWILRGSSDDVSIPAVPVALIPVLVFPGRDRASDTAMIDSTFQIKRLEEIYFERSLIPSDPALAFLQELVEDYGDEWLTKPMFHFRWTYADDIDKASHVLVSDRDTAIAPEMLAELSKAFGARQIGRLRVVGSNPTTTPIIEASYRRLLSILDSHLVAGNRYLMGGRPGVGDFGLFGQLTQLAHFDPTSAAIAAKTAPRVVSWVSNLDDASSIEVSADDWIDRSRAGGTLRAFFAEIGRVYAPFLIANARALRSKAAEVRCEIDGCEWIQQPFPYQGKCLGWLRQAHAALKAQDRDFVDSFLEGTGAGAIFSASI